MTTYIYLQGHLALTYVGDIYPAILTGTTGTTPLCLFVSYASCEHDIGLAVLMPCYRATAPCVFKLSADLSLKPQTEKHVGGCDNFISVSIATAKRERGVCLDVSSIGDRASERREL